MNRNKSKHRLPPVSLISDARNNLSQRDSVACKQQLLEDKNRLLLEIAQEMRTPLTIIHGVNEQLHNIGVSGLERSNLLALLDNNTERLMAFVRQVQLTAQLREKRAIEASVVPLSALVRTTIAHLSALCELHHHSFRSYIAEEISVIGGSVELEHLVVNLLKNAIYHSGDDAGITVRLDIDQQQAILQVRDNGKGIDVNTPAFAFRTSEDKAEQTGALNSWLGLSLAKDIVDVHKGQITIDCRTDQGTTIKVVLPDASICETRMTYHVQHPPIAKTTLLPETGANAVIGEQPHLLVVDDEPDIISLLNMQLSKDYRLTFTANGEMALLALETIQPDLILTDKVMPKLDGLGLIRELRVRPKFRDVPVILMSSDSCADSQATGWENGADACLEKPFSYKLLKATIKRLLARRETPVFCQESQPLTDTMRPSPPENAFINQVNQLVSQYFKDDSFSVDHMAVHFPMSRRNFQRKLKSVIGESLTRYLHRYRCQQAKQLMQDNHNIGLEELACRCGFKSSASLRSWFQDIFGITPSEHRRTLKKLDSTR